MIQFDMRQQDKRARYNLTAGIVVPRPIALITSINEDGLVNAAPFSAFNFLGTDPPIVAFAPGLYSVNPPVPKDTRRNVLATGEFVVNMVNEDLLEAMTIAGANFPPEVSEIEAMGVSLLPSVDVRPPRIAESPAHLECKVAKDLDLGRNKIIFGEILRMHIREDLIDPERLHIRYDKLNFVGRTAGGGGVYSRTNDLLIAPRITYDEIQAGARLSDLPPAALQGTEVLRTKER
jgi:flavin reductase (DIM6/NTAB) family NADH-FMN oxidoreductase RutF